MGKELSHPLFVNGITLWGRIRNPKVDLERAIGLRANVRGPGADRLRLHKQRAAAAKPGAPVQVRQNLALVLGLQGRLGEAEATLKDALAQLRMAFVQLSEQAAGGEVEAPAED